MAIQLSIGQLIKALDKLGIRHRNESNSKGWIPIICPNHPAKSFNTCSTNVNSGYIHCWSCGYKESLFSYIMKVRQCSFKESLDFIEYGHYVTAPQIVAEKKEVKFESKYYNKNSYSYNFTSMPVKPEDYYYTVQRGFTQEFCSMFGIERVFSFPYSDYYCIPVVDTERDIYTFEFRKLMEYEYLKKYYNTDIPFKRLKRRFEYDCEAENIYMEDFKVYRNGSVEVNDTLQYLLSPKVKYERNSTLRFTLWNIDNLRYDQPLYLCEGIGSICKIWTHISKNVTCTFGSNVTEEQLELLTKFVKVVIIPDDDSAGFKMVSSISNKLNDALVVIPIKEEDTDYSYIDSIKSTKETSGREYVGINLVYNITNN